jgi:sugar phosphate isomerase/epimerase
MDWSFQLYSARDFQPWASVFDMLARLGYTQVEGYGDLYLDAAAKRAELDRAGLSMPSGHFALELLEDDFPAAHRTAKTLGMGMIACPYLEAAGRPADAAGWRDFGLRLGSIGKAAADAGLGFAWHNHEFEFEALADGSMPLTHILDAAPAIGWEIDVAWVIRGGADPLACIDRYGERIVAAHVKDIAPQGEALHEDGWADVGHGTVDWPGLMGALRGKTPAKIFVMEHDNPADLERFARRSIDTAKTFEA